jgi:hypothetical protein
VRCGVAMPRRPATEPRPGASGNGGFLAAVVVACTLVPTIVRVAAHRNA